MTDQTTRLPIRRALISVSDKTGILEFARELEALGVEILSTGGTFKLLQDNGVAAVEVAVMGDEAHFVFSAFLFLLLGLVVLLLGIRVGWRGVLWKLSWVWLTEMCKASSVSYFCWKARAGGCKRHSNSGPLLC